MAALPKEIYQSPDMLSQGSPEATSSGTQRGLYTSLAVVDEAPEHCCREAMLAARVSSVARQRGTSGRTDTPGTRR